jgi:hypothetical protein
VEGNVAATRRNLTLNHLYWDGPGFNATSEGRKDGGYADRHVLGVWSR